MIAKTVSQTFKSIKNIGPLFPKSIEDFNRGQRATFIIDINPAVMRIIKTYYSNWRPDGELVNCGCNSKEGAGVLTAVV
jgi:hypothetical protein